MENTVDNNFIVETVFVEKQLRLGNKLITLVYYYMCVICA
jgi:hypothetical protein